MPLSFITNQPGVTTDSIDRLVHQAIISENAYPSPLKYRFVSLRTVFGSILGLLIQCNHFQNQYVLLSTRHIYLEFFSFLTYLDHVSRNSRLDCADGRGYRLR